MNQENLSKILANYGDKLEFLNTDPQDEWFKWEAVQRFQQEWAKDLPFAEKLKEATSKSSVLLDNGHVSPLSGILKMAECAPQEVERLFVEVLFADDGGDLALRQHHMDAFLEGIEAVRQQHFPQCWKYGQNRNTASVYLALYAPEDNYIYKHTAAEAFAKHSEFGFDIGIGETFSLANYYKLCDLLVAALEADAALVKKQEKYRNNLYTDEKLHLLAFDVMYCAKTYGLYHGVESLTKRESLQAQKLADQEAQEALVRLAKVEQLQREIHQLEQENEEFYAISLLHVQVHHKQYGVGMIIAQTGTTVMVEFQEKTTKFIINKKFSARPTFENDAEIVEIFTQYDVRTTQIERLKKELAKLSV
ncbi:hypothetical protein RFF05_12900 [Bengtsoniella intestinalis]|uniref:hypothetical protein n=1 Tax=Bengtsoniella intestinalis TaxID=3073143 RepID=UPI00391F7CE0